MKKKILALSFVAVFAAVALISGTLAYFTDTDAKDNVFVSGNVEIELIENFGDNDALTPEKLLPATGSAQAGTLENGIVKEVSVKNIGSEDAFVRVHIAIPKILDSGNPEFDAGNNVLHFNFSGDSLGEDLWDWTTSAGAPYTGLPWNYYETVIDDIDYNVYVVTYGTALASGAETLEKAMTQVYLDSRVTNEDMAAIMETLGENWQIKVLSEGVQAAGFADAYEALNTAFGVPGSYTVDWSGAVDQ